MGKLEPSKQDLNTMQSFFSVLLVLVCGLLAIGIIRLDQMTHNCWVKAHPAIRYLQASQANRDPWRWRKPDPKTTQILYESSLSLGIKDFDGVSRFLFPVEFPLEFRALTYAFLYLQGLLLVSIGFSFLLKATGSNFGGRLFLCLILCSCGLWILRIGPVIQIDLYPQHLEIVTLSAFFWRLTTVYQRKQILRISGRAQSSWSKIKGQIHPDYKLTLMRSLIPAIPMSQTFSLVCNPTTGSWVVGGLNHWKSLSI
jgi:hypothetical protein